MSVVIIIYRAGSGGDGVGGGGGRGNIPRESEIAGATTRAVPHTPDVPDIGSWPTFAATCTNKKKKTVDKYFKINYLVIYGKYLLRISTYAILLYGENTTGIVRRFI